MQLRKAARVILVGAPGVGKGTQSERLLKRFPQLQTISSGDLLRSNVKRRTPLGIKVENTMKAGGLVSDDLILRVIGNEFYQRGWISLPAGHSAMTLASSGEASAVALEPESEPPLAASNSFVGTPSVLESVPRPIFSDDPACSFLLDGFPRTQGQAASLDRVVPINLVISIITPFDVLLRRITSRWVHEPSGRVYNTAFNAPRVAGRDDVTGEPLKQRSDDTEDVYRARYVKFQETAGPLLEHYARRGLVMEVEGMSSDEISPKLFEAFGRMYG
ncbi:Adenylate kinase 2 [Ceratocystis pirilliformis]|uniref:GTP:AMP phosphotransferase, mitochondrial n=1 Tax=Ceratocystis pirilliformis TaxID=259994 RepID=A0ABR3Z6D4_9PEZI